MSMHAAQHKDNRKQHKRGPFLPFSKALEYDMRPSFGLSLPEAGRKVDANAERSANPTRFNISAQQVKHPSPPPPGLPLLNIQLSPCGTRPLNLAQRHPQGAISSWLHREHAKPSRVCSQVGLHVHQLRVELCVVVP